MLHTIALINESTVVPDLEAQQIAHSLQRQVNRDFAPVWGTNAAVISIPKGQAPPAGAWWLVLLDNMEVAGALGYHDLTPQLKPIGYVGAKIDLKYGAKVSVTCSHELLEMLGDPLINLLVEDPAAGRLYAFENCDPVEADDLGYDVAGQTMSDFVLPSYFDLNEMGKSHPLSFRGNVHAPFELAPGGYLSYRPIGESEWQQETASKIAEPLRAMGERAPGFPPGSRRERRIRAGQGKLVVSTIHTGG